ncbi:MAG: ATP synthase F1 subunit gamma [Erysipelotrichaceae bacterium]|jgi:F-type H+-transporting ATPase subunit gamma|nr:ATP synthase F1 subunit gamma [Erysipelotrichaceae bacterium]MBQ1625068.1 ATP synthase F1 subunit gamma [Erysipelotrichaceae bacterium]MBQ1692469.1 ATP synthase F1 subunit gamma [Erysipelotrichaceae bacterium]MBQ1776119.1 ATP synthase F1 subunit gamma [Erysipelotrichaceae bacterium]MBQ1811256.1 ATP synthase F1 subunit gamma [Erysipelotrichaceae bacterium]
MAGQISAIKKRLQTVNSTRKLTNATELVATVKLQKYNTKTRLNEEYSKNLRRFIMLALKGKGPEVEDNPYLVSHDIQNPLYIVITSNSGLCGSYNLEVLKFVEEHVSKDVPIFAIGTIGYNWLMKNDYLVVKRYDELEDLQPSILNTMIDNILTLYTQFEMNEINVVYTKYINTLTYEPTLMKLLPLQMANEDETDETLLLEPSRNEVLDELIPMYISSQIYVAFLEAKTSENAARRNAMNQANKNADKLINELQLYYNKARQAAITQEMNEIVASSGRKAREES